MSTASPTVTQTGVYKPIDDAWIGLLVLAILIFVLSIIGLILLLILWNRYQKQKQLVKDVDKSTATSNVTTNAAGAARRPIPVQVEPYPPTNYETQVSSLDGLTQTSSKIFFSLAHGTVCSSE